MTQNNDQIEQILLQYRPADPPATLRPRVLSLLERPVPGQRNRAVWFFRAAVAAMLILSCGLNFAADAMNDDLLDSIGLGPAVWTEDAEELSKIIDDNDWARQYIALGLMTRPSLGTFPQQPPTIPGDL